MFDVNEGGEEGRDESNNLLWHLAIGIRIFNSGQFLQIRSLLKCTMTLKFD